MRRFTREEFVKHLRSKTQDWDLIGDYKNALTRTEFKHKPCGHIYLKTPYNVTSKPSMCQYCNANRLRGEGAFLKRAEKKIDYEILGEYKNSRTKILVRHKVCGKEFYTIPYNFLKTTEGCPYCSSSAISKSRTWTHEKFLEAVGERADEYEFLTDYVDAHTKIKIRHCCGNEFEMTPDSFLRGGRCRACKYSTGEGKIYRFIKHTVPSEEVIQSERTILPNRSEIDIYLPERKIGIEYDGLMYHTVEHFLSDKRRKWTKAKAQGRQEWKTNECERRGIRLIHIFEDEWLEHQDIVEDKLRAILRVPMKRYYARKLELRTVSRDVADAFYEANHIQGKTNVSVSIGLYDGDSLVALQSFLPYTRRKSDNVWELVRYATRLGVRVVGGFSKCLKWFERNYSPNEVVSFADRRWSDPFSNVYEKNGFAKDGKVPRSYWYVKAPKRFHKFGFRKSRIKSKYPEIYSPDKTEVQMAKEIGLQKIYDCGLIRYNKKYEQDNRYHRPELYSIPENLSS